MKTSRINFLHFRFILFDLKIFGEIVTPIFVDQTLNRFRELRAEC